MLADLPVLFVDCQATGASPKHGALIEVAWGADAESIEDTLVALDEDGRVPRRVAQLTGINTQMLEDAPPPTAVAERLRAAMEGRTLVAHFARYEQAFLRDLLADDALEIVCTHAVAKRVLADLPRHSLRAVAGYFGAPLGEAKRGADHVRGTVAAWRGLVRLLADRGVVDLDGLRALCARPARRNTGQRRYAIPRGKRLGLPKGPGIYRLLGRGGEVLYVGKATSLHDRVNSYFRGRKGKADRTLELVSQVHDVSVVRTRSALEAALIEPDEVKRHAPPYNERLRRRKRRIAFAAADLSEIVEAPDAAHPLGPFSSAHAAHRLGALVRGDDLRWWWGAEPEVVEAGLAAFRTEHGLASPTLVDLLVLGRSLWAAADDEEEEEEDEGQAESARSWTPELVTETARHVVVQGAWAVRRAAWLAHLYDVRLRWRTTTGDLRALRLRAGVPQRGAPVAEPRLERRAAFDLATYDRVAALGVEVRRVLREGRLVALETGYDHFESARLARRLGSL